MPRGDESPAEGSGGDCPPVQDWRRRPRRRRKPATGSERSPKRRSTAAGRLFPAGEPANARSARRRSIASDTGSVGSTPCFSSAAAFSSAMVFRTWLRVDDGEGRAAMAAHGVALHVNGRAAVRAVDLLDAVAQLAHLFLARRTHEVPGAQELIVRDEAAVPLRAPVVGEPRVALDIVGFSQLARTARASRRGGPRLPPSRLGPRRRTPRAAASRQGVICRNSWSSNHRHWQ